MTTWWDDVLAETYPRPHHGVDEKCWKRTGIRRESGFRVIANTDASAGQTVHHLHLHVLGGEGLGEGLLPLLSSQPGRRERWLARATERANEAGI